MLKPLFMALAFADRDSGKWNLDPRETFRRRSLFYELYTYDSWQVCDYFVDVDPEYSPFTNRA